MWPGLRAIVAIQAAHQRRLADAGRSGQHDALAGMQFEPDARQHRDAHAALQMQREALRQRIGAQHKLPVIASLRQRFVQRMQRMVMPCDQRMPIAA